MLQSFGFACQIACTQDDALRLCAAERFAFSIISEQLPDGDGVSLFTRLKQLQAGMEGVLLSGIANLNTVWSAVSAGMQRVIAEPISLSEVAAAMRSTSSNAVVAAASKGVDTQRETIETIARLTSEEIRFDLTHTDLVELIRSVDYPFSQRDQLGQFDRDSLERIVLLVRSWCRGQFGGKRQHP